MTIAPRENVRQRKRRQRRHWNNVRQRHRREKLALAALLDETWDGQVYKPLGCAADTASANHDHEMHDPELRVVDDDEKGAHTDDGWVHLDELTDRWPPTTTDDQAVPAYLPVGSSRLWSLGSWALWG